MDWDVIIVGGGSAGSAVASQCARRGLATLLLERHALDGAGARWVNGIFGEAFDQAGVSRPSAPELRGEGRRFVLVAGWGPVSMAIENTGMLDVDMRYLSARLRADAKAHGAELRENTPVRGVEPGRVHLDEGVQSAPVIVDASGLGGLFRRDKPQARDVCAAAQGVFRVCDRARAEAFFSRFSAAPGETICFASVAGGYSIVNARLEGDEVSILTGSLPALGHRSGKALRDDFAARHRDWVGEMVFGGQAPIPLHRPHRRLAFGDGGRSPRAVVVRFGDAAGHVYAAHGSGIGAQLVGARMLAERLAERGPRGAFDFERAWHRRFGARFLAADLFRRASMRLGPRALETIIGRRLIPAALVRTGFAAGL